MLSSLIVKNLGALSWWNSEKRRFYLSSRHGNTWKCTRMGVPLNHLWEWDFPVPRCSTYGISTYIWVIFRVHVGKKKTYMEHIGYKPTILGTPHFMETSQWATEEGGFLSVAFGGPERIRQVGGRWALTTTTEMGLMWFQLRCKHGQNKQYICICKYVDYYIFCILHITYIYNVYTLHGIYIYTY